MRKIYRLLLVVFLISGVAISSYAQNSFFNDVSESSLKAASGARSIVPAKYRTLKLDITGLRTFLWALPSEKSVISNKRLAPVMSLPMPDGSIGRFRVWESSIQEPALQAKFPEIRTFAGQGIDDPYATIRFDFNPSFGFSAQILSDVTGRIYLDQYAKGNLENYISYFHKDNKRVASFNCLTEDAPQTGSNQLPRGSVLRAGPCRGAELVSYRLAVSCTGEYAQIAGSPAATHARIVATVNRVTQVYENDLSIRLILVANNDLIEFQDPNTDPFANDGSSGTANSDLNINTGVINNAIGALNYDIGHLFCTNESGGVGAGVAGVGVVCTTSKGAGLTGRGNPTGDGYDIDYVAHEMGHQFGARHTFNTNTCFGGAGAGGSYEPGGGTTIMAYAGICGSTENIQPNSDPLFHAFSFDQISTFVTSGNGASCGTRSSTGNTLPVITSMGTNDVSIPIGTPFVLTGAATDADGDALTYNWEGWDLGAAASWPSAATSTSRPLFRTRVSKTTGSRTFPDMRVIVANYPGTAAPSAMDGLRGETLPQVARAMKFRLTVRDNRAGGGGVVSGGGGCGSLFPQSFTVNAVGTTPFAVTAPNGGESYAANSTQTITWNNAGSNVAPINVSNVKISLSTDGGFTYPIVLLESTANDGSEAIVIPNNPSTTARIKIEAIGNIFFDISNANFTITAPLTGFTFVAPAPTTVACSGPATATVNLATTSVGGYNTAIALTATGTPAGTNISFAPSSVVPGSTSVVTLNNANTLAAGTYNITVTGISGTITQTQVVSFVVSQGTPPTLTAPSNQTVCAGLPANFTVTSSGTATGYQWQVSTVAAPVFTNITGATAATYSIAATSSAQNGNQYRVIVTTQCSAATSAAARLTVQASPAITTEPQSTIVCANTNASFNVVATGAGLTYQWQLSTDAGVTWNNVTGETTATILVNSVTASQSGHRYRVIVTGTCIPAITSNAAELTVGDAATITSQPLSKVECVGANTSFTATASGSNITYQWQVSTAAVPAFTNIAGATLATLTLNAVTAAQNGNQYRVIVFSCTPTGITSNAVTLTVNTPVTIGTQPQASTLCVGIAANFSVGATGTDVSYQWQYSSSCTGTFTDIPGATSATYSIPSVQTTNAGAYRVSLGGACGSVTSTCVLLTVNTPVVVTTQPTDLSICLPLTGTIDGTFSIVATGTGAKYQWQVSTDAGATFTNITGATSATLTLSNVTASMTGYKYRVVLSGTCSTLFNSNEVTLTVNTPVDITKQPTSIKTCAGKDVEFTVEATGSTISYQWQVSINGGAFLNVSSAAPYSGETTKTLKITNAQTVLSGYRYRVIVSGVPCGEVNSSIVTLTVNTNPLPILTLASNASINPAIRSTLGVTVSPAGTYTYQWYRNNTLIPSITTATYSVSVDDFGEYNVVVTNANGCNNTTNKVAVTEQPSSDLFIYPNPNSGVFQVRYYNAAAGSYTRTLTIYDSKGAKVFAKQYELTGAYGRMDVNLRNAGKGVYHVELRDASGKRLATGKVVIK